MFFTQEDFKKIEKWLSQNAVKDTEFNEAVLPLNGNEEITIIQGNHNKKVLLKDLVNNIKLLGNFDFINVSESFNAKYISLQNAISLIPHRGRKIGQVITFLGTDGNWGIYQFKGESLEVWNNITLWINIIESLHIDSILPDEEDLTITTPDVQGNVKMKFKDKDYNPLDFSGLGKIYLRKNITTIIDTENNIAKDINLLTQQAFSKENTIYIIQYDYDLQGETINIPKGCVLKFNGGSFTNGTINGNNTSIDAIPTKIFDSVGGSWNIEYSYAEWFGAKADGITDCFASIYKALNMMPYHCKLLRGSYAISNPIVMSYRRKLSGQQGDETKIIPTEGASMDCLILVSNSDATGYTAYGHIRDLGVYNSPEVGIKCVGTTQGFNIENVEIKHCADAGLLVSKCWYASFKNINSWHNKYGLVLCASDRIDGDTAVNGIKFDTCWFNQNTLNSVFSNGNTTAVSFDGCTFEGSTTEGESEIKCVSFYSDISLYSCYMETDRCGFDIKPSYRAGQFSIYGGIYHFRTPTTYLADFGLLDVFNCIGAYWIINDYSKMPGACIHSDASVNNTSSRFPNSPTVWEATGNVISMNLAGGLTDTYYLCQARSWQTNNLSITHDGFAKSGSTASLFLGINRNIHVDYNYGIKGLIIDQSSTGVATSDRINFKVRRTVNKTNNEDTTFMSVNNYGNVDFSGSVRGKIVTVKGASSNRPNFGYADVGMCYFDTDLGKPIWMKANGVWVDASGSQV